MNKTILQAIEKLRNASAHLNKLTDEAADVIKLVEGFLNDECSSGVWASVVVSRHGDPHEPAELTVTRYLAYCRVGPRFRIAVNWDCEADPGGAEPKAWSDCTRDDKLETLEKLPDLIAAISSKLDEKIENAQKSLSAAMKVTDALVGKAG